MKGKKPKRDGARIILLLVSFFVLALLPGCAALRTVVKGPPLTDPQIDAIVSKIDQQQALVSSFYSSGTALFKDGILEAEADALIVGTGEPLRLKIELTHSWGKPLLHVLVDRARLEVLSFKDRKLYVGTFSPDALSGFLPGGLDARMIWAVLRGYPALLQSSDIISREAGRLIVLDERGSELQIVNLGGEKKDPAAFRLIRQGVKVTFEDYQSIGAILFARKVGIEHPESNKSLVLTRKKTVFNKTIPEAIFALEKPPHFDEASIEEIR